MKKIHCFILLALIGFMSCPRMVVTPVEAANKSDLKVDLKVTVNKLRNTLEIVGTVTNLGPNTSAAGERLVDLSLSESGGNAAIIILLNKAYVPSLAPINQQTVVLKTSKSFSISKVIPLPIDAKKQYVIGARITDSDADANKSNDTVSQPFTPQ